ncbi:hypothetical protein [Campylobacter sp.]|uniref:hypothetical protein n=1 Tax=Campylobacter sp. TaxID=205 RepID=UPI0025EA03AA|nr:hypothetical protein [Campylobacter sp.]
MIGADDRSGVDVANDVAGWTDCVIGVANDATGRVFGAGAKDGACGAKISTRKPLNSKLCIAKALKVIKI